MRTSTKRMRDIRNGRWLRSLICLAIMAFTLVAFGCATKNAQTQNEPGSESSPSTTSGVQSAELSPHENPASGTDNTVAGNASIEALRPGSESLTADTRTALVVDKAQRVGALEGSELNEISGISSSEQYPGIMYAINDSGNAARLYALTETGELVESWEVAARNRDWEDMSHITLQGTPYLIIGDTGNNLIRARNSQLLLLPEPSIPAESDTLAPTHTVQFDFIDGPHNVEAIATIGNSVYMLSKEPVSVAGPSPSGVYRLDLPDNVLSMDEDVTLRAQFVATMPRRSLGLQASLAASLAGVDLSHPTAMTYDPITNSFYVLSYREVLRIAMGDHQGWAEAFGSEAQRLLSHNLRQAEALTLSKARTILFTSENAGAPVWAIPLQAPL